MSTYKAHISCTDLQVPEHLKNVLLLRHPLTEEQVALYEQFRASLGSDIYLNPWEPEEVWLTRFLIARQWNLENAKTMYLETKQWRSTIFPQRVTAENVLRQIKFRVFEFTRIRDKYGRPLVITTGRRANPSLNDSVAVVEEGFIWGMELLAKMCRPPTNHFVHVMDLQDWGPIKNFSRKYTQATAKISQSYYPDYMGATFIINYPWAVWGAYKITELLLDPHTLEKVHFLKKEDSDRVMRELFNPDELPQRLGGNKVEVHPPSSEFDKLEIEAWQAMARLPEQERIAAFEKALEDYLSGCSEEEATFWRHVRNSDADPYNVPGSSTSTSSSSSAEQ